MNDSIYDERSQIKLKIKSAKKIKDAEIASSIDVPEHLTKTVELAKDKGSSSYLTTLPLEKYGFHLSKREFRNAIALRYGWLPERLPSKCVCDETFTVEHALSCPRGALPMIRHNEVRDLSGMLLTEVCHNVKLEPGLQPDRRRAEL